MEKKILNSIIMLAIVLLASSGMVSATEIKFIPLGNNSMLAIYGSSTKTIACAEEKTINVNAECDSSLYEASCQGRVNDKEQQMRNICNQEKTILNSSLKCEVCQNTNTIQIIDNKNETDSLKTQLGAEKKSKERYLALLIVSVVLLVIITILALFLAFKPEHPKNKERVVVSRKIVSAILILALLPSLALADTITTNIQVNMTNSTITLITEGGSIPFTYSPGTAYSPVSISFNRNLTISSNCSIINNTNTYIYNYTINASMVCPVPVVNAPCICTDVNYSRFNVSVDCKVDTSEVEKTCSGLNDYIKGATIEKTINNTIYEKGECKGTAWWVWLIVIFSTTIVSFAIGALGMYFYNKKKVKS